MKTFYFVKWIDKKLQKNVNIPCLYHERYPVLQFTQKEDHNELRESQAHKTLFIVPTDQHDTLKYKVVKSEASRQKWTQRYMDEYKNYKTRSSSPLIHHVRVPVRIDFHLNFDTFEYSKILWNVKRWTDLPRNRLYLWVCTIREQDCETQSDSDQVCLYKGSQKHVRWHCLEVENQLELTSKHKGIIQLLDSSEFLLGAGEVYVDKKNKTVIINNQTGTLRNPMARNGERLFRYGSPEVFGVQTSYGFPFGLAPSFSLTGLSKNSYNVRGDVASYLRAEHWKAWQLQRTVLDQQLDCPFLNYFMMPLAKRACSKSYAFIFNRVLKQDKCKLVNYGYVQHIIDHEKNIQCSVMSLCGNK